MGGRRAPCRARGAAPARPSAPCSRRPGGPAARRSSPWNQETTSRSHQDPWGISTGCSTRPPSPGLSWFPAAGSRLSGCPAARPPGRPAARLDDATGGFPPPRPWAPRG
ncbi:hypothetical protein ATKI12_6442 [Kitasatospora sp. Ki12]